MHGLRTHLPFAHDYAIEEFHLPTNADHFTEYPRASMQAENALLNVLMPWS